MKYTIELGKSSKDKLVFGILKELGIKFMKAATPTKSVLTAKDVALGIGRKATTAELKEYFERAEKSEAIDIEDLIALYKK